MRSLSANRQCCARLQQKSSPLPFAPGPVGFKSFAVHTIICPLVSCSARLAPTFSSRPGRLSSSGSPPVCRAGDAPVSTPRPPTSPSTATGVVLSSPKGPPGRDPSLRPPRLTEGHPQHAGQQSTICTREEYRAVRERGCLSQRAGPASTCWEVGLLRRTTRG